MKTKSKAHHDADLRPEYDFSKIKGGVRGKYVQRYRKGTNLVRLDRDVAQAFPMKLRSTKLYALPSSCRRRSDRRGGCPASARAGHASERLISIGFGQRAAFSKCPTYPKLSPVRRARFKGRSRGSACRVPLPARASLWPFLARSCGGPLTPTCPACGTRNEPGEKSCGDCGASLAQGNVEGAGPHREPRAYTPKHLAGRTLITRGAPRGRAKAGDRIARRREGLHGAGGAD